MAVESAPPFLSAALPVGTAQGRGGGRDAVRELLLQSASYTASRNSGIPSALGMSAPVGGQAAELLR